MKHLAPDQMSADTDGGHDEPRYGTNGVDGEALFDRFVQALLSQLGFAQNGATAEPRIADQPQG